MSGNDIKASMEYRGKMVGYLQSGAVMDGADDWIRMELHNHQREMQAGVAAQLRRERRQEMKNARVAPRANGLRARLKRLITLIVTYSAPPEKERIQ